MPDWRKQHGKTNFLHTIRPCIDAGLSSTYRALLPTDIHSTVNVSNPTQVLIGLESTDFEGKINEEALVGACQCKPGCRGFHAGGPFFRHPQDTDGDFGESAFIAS